MPVLFLKHRPIGSQQGHDLCWMLFTCISWGVAAQITPRPLPPRSLPTLDVVDVIVPPSNTSCVSAGSFGVERYSLLACCKHILLIIEFGPFAIYWGDGAGPSACTLEFLVLLVGKIGEIYGAGILSFRGDKLRGCNTLLLGECIRCPTWFSFTCPRSSFEVIYDLGLYLLWAA